MNYQRELEYLSSIEQLRVLRAVSAREGKYVMINNRKLMDLSSNDYLGIAGDSSLRKRFLSEVDIAKYPFSASASRLMSGNNIVLDELELLLAKLYTGKEALVFGSGFQANIGVIPALIDKKAVIFADKQVHASIIDGILLSGAKLYRYKHNDMNSLNGLLAKYRDNFENAWVITESIFSMDGDTADIKTLVAYKNKYKFSLYVDEAHAFGVRGKNGEGVCVELGLAEQVDVMIGTFGKALASVGAFVACDKEMKQYLVNKARSFIFSTALPPINILWTKWLLENLQLLLVEQRTKLQKMSDDFRRKVKALGYEVTGDSHIVSIVIGDNKSTLKLSKQLEEAGFLVFAVRPPTVPMGSSRLRISLNAELDASDISQLVEALSLCWSVGAR